MALAVHYTVCQIFLFYFLKLTALQYQKYPYPTQGATIPAKKKLGHLSVEHVSPIRPNQCWKISRFFQQKGKKSPNYQHCKWGEGRTCLVSQLFVRDCVKKNLKNVTELAVTEAQREGSCTLWHVIVTHTAKRGINKMDQNPPMKKYFSMTFARCRK